MGAAPSPGNQHRYRFTLYALDKSLNLEPSSDSQHLLAAMQGHVLAEADLAGIYQR